MSDWLTDNYLKLLTVVRDIGEDGCRTGAIDAPKLRLEVSTRRQIIQKLVSDGEHSQAEIAEMLGVSQQTVSNDYQELVNPKEKKREERLARNAEISANNHALPVDQRKYAVIYADPPWSFKVWSGAGKDRAAENHYPTMTQDEIEALPVADLATDDCALFMWAVMPQLPEALSVIDAWGFEYKTCAFVWVKQTKDEGKLATGMGYWTRANAEVCLLATRGSPQRLNADVHQIIMSPRAEHSKKPDEVANRIQRLVPGPYIELFSRQTREGWDSWGNQSNV